MLVACASRAEARRIARSLVESRLAACASILGAGVESLYRWKGKIESAREYLLVIKSERRRFRALAERVRRLHTYEVPEIVALPIMAGLPEYLAWVAESVRGSSR